MRKISKVCSGSLLTMLVLMGFRSNIYSDPAIIDNIQQIERVYSDDEVDMDLVDTGLFEQQISSSLQLIPEIADGDVVIDNVIDVPDWNGVSGGVYFLETTGTVTITETGVINATGKGYRGGVGGSGYPSQGQQGESILGIGGYYWEANGAGGGGGRKGGACCGSFGGGGGAHVTDGTKGEGGDAANCICPPYIVRIGRYGRPGIAIGEVVDFGAGGGGGNGGSYWNTTGLKGGNGGGIIRIKACKIIVRGRLEANGADGQDVPWAQGDTGGGGGGGGGTIWLEAVEIIMDGETLSVDGGIGSRNPDPFYRDRANGGDGGEGFIEIDEIFCVEIEGPKFLHLYKTNTPRAILNAIVTPPAMSGGIYQWQIVVGNDKVNIVGATTQPSLTIKGEKESEPKDDVDIKIAYTIGVTTAESHHALTVQKPTKLTREDLEFVRREVEVGGIVIATYVGCKRFNGTLHDQLQIPMDGVPMSERIRFDMRKSHPKRFLPFARTGSTVTNDTGGYSDIYLVPIVGAAPLDTHIEIEQTIIGGGWEGDNRIIITNYSVSDSYPIYLR